MKEILKVKNSFLFVLLVKLKKILCFHTTIFGGQL